MIRSLFAAAALLALCTGGAACASPTEGDDASSEDLRRLQSGDVDEVIIDHVAVGSPAPDTLGGVASWSVHHVQLRDPKNPDRPDPVDPFNGFFLIAKDKDEKPLFFDTLALTEGGVAHFYFSFRVDAEGNYVEMPLLAASNDATEVARAERTVAWLGAERLRLGHAIREAYATDLGRADDVATRGLGGSNGLDGAALGGVGGSMEASALGPRTTNFEAWTAGIKCAAELAVFVLTFTSPVAYLFAQGAVDGTFAIVDAVAGSEEASGAATRAAVEATLGELFRRIGKGVTRAVEKNIISAATGANVHASGVPAMRLGMAAVVGYQIYQHGLVDGLKVAATSAIPLSCRKTYATLTEMPR